MSSFIIKAIAAFTMCMDHLYYVIPNANYIFLYIGRISYPLFAFQATIGYSHTKNIKKHCLRLLLFAIISQIPFMLLFQKYEFNIFFTLLLGIIGLYIWDKCNNKIIGFIAILLFSAIAQFAHFDYGAFGILSIFIFYVFRENKLLMNLSFILLAFFKYLPTFIVSNFYYPYILIFLFTLVPLLFIYFYNGKKGKDMKYFLYLFYPVHIIVFYLLKIYLF